MAQAKKPTDATLQPGQALAEVIAIMERVAVSDRERVLAAVEAYLEIRPDEDVA